VRLLLETMAELIAAHSSQADLIRSIVDRAIHSVEAERGILLLLNERGELQPIVARDNQRRELADQFRYSTQLVKQVHESGEAVSLRVSASEQPEDLSASVVDLKLRAVMCARLTFQQKVLGVIYVDSRVAAREFTELDLRYFEALAGALSIALENSRLLREALERERLQRSIELARDILGELLPDDPLGVPGFEIAGLSVPAEDAAGDYYDFIRTRSGSVFAVVGDVTGHGIGPAVLMASARSALRILSEERLSEGQILERLNRRLGEDLSDDRFMTMLLCRIDPSSRSLHCANAGHNPPLILRSDGSAADASDPGPPLGVVPGARYVDQRAIELLSGDLIALYTDGVEETATAGGELFGRDRLAALLHRLRAHPAAEILREVVAALGAFSGRANQDDVTLVVVRVLPH